MGVQWSPGELSEQMCLQASSAQATRSARCISQMQLDGKEVVQPLFFSLGFHTPPLSFPPLPSLLLPPFPDFLLLQMGEQLWFCTALVCYHLNPTTLTLGHASAGRRYGVPLIRHPSSASQSRCQTQARQPGAGAVAPESECNRRACCSG